MATGHAWRDQFPHAARSPSQIYLSRIPRFMKPVTVRQLLARYGEVTRIYIVPEGASCALPGRRLLPHVLHRTCGHARRSTESAVRAARVRKGGSRRENWIEGWVEYADKQTAKLVASQLNTTPVGACAGQRLTLLRMATCLHSSPCPHRSQGQRPVWGRVVDDEVLVWLQVGALEGEAR